jgi:hypothetical protein
MVVAHNVMDDVSMMQDPSERLHLSVSLVDDTMDMRELDVAVLSPFLNRKVLNVGVPRMFSRSIHIHLLMAEFVSSCGRG